MEKFEEVINDVGENPQISLEEIPDIDLYMDQIIQLFEKKFTSTKRNGDEKVLTKTMINNYAKGKLFFSIKNKKYSKEHLILISLIYQLKGTLSLNDIKETLAPINEIAMMDEAEMGIIYQSFLNLTERNSRNFILEINEMEGDVKTEIDNLGELRSVELEEALLIASLANMSLLYRRAAERLIDRMGLTKSEK